MHLDYKNLGVGTAIIDSLESLLSDLKSQAGNVRSFPPEYPGNLMSSINEVADAVDSINGAELQALQQKVTTVTQQIQSPSFGFTNPEYSDFLEGYNSFNNVLNNIKNNDGEILDSYDTQIFNEYTQENNTANALEFYSKKNIQGTLTEEEAKVYKNLQDEHRYATKNAYNDNMNREVAAYEIKESEKSWWDKTTESIYGAWNDITDAISETGSTWVTAFKSGNFNDYLQALKETGSTLFVAGSSVLAGVQKIEEFVVDGIVFLGGTVVSGIVLLGDKIFGTDNASYIMDGTLDFIRRDLVGEARKKFYEDTGLGKWINDNSNLKYDSQGANGIQSLTEVAAKIAIATAATIATGGAAAPIAIGLLYGFGNATEKYTQSVDRENGESYDYKKAILKAIAGGAAGAAEFYGYGQMGAAVLGKGITEAASTSFVKNFINTDTAVDTLSVVIDHGVNVALGDESWQDVLFYGGAEVLLGLGMSAIGARKATKAARSAELADDIGDALRKVDVDGTTQNVTKIDTESSKFKKYNDYNAFKEAYADYTKDWFDNLSDHEKSLFYNYISEGIFYEGNYKAVNSIKRGNFVNYDNGTINVRGSFGGIDTYTFDDFERMYDQSIDEFIIKQSNAADELNMAIHKAGLKEDTILYRGTNWDSLEKYGINKGDDPNLILEKLQGNGGTYVDEGFMSATPVPDSPITAEKPIILEMNCEKGTPAADLSTINDMEQEVLLGLGQVFSIDGVSDNGGQIIIHMTHQ